MLVIKQNLIGHRIIDNKIAMPQASVSYYEVILPLISFTSYPQGQFCSQQEQQ